jgi:valyl-tRNA synthetase
LVNGTFDQKEILLNNLFLKQIWNAVRLCIQKEFLPNNIEECLKNDPEDFDEFEIHVLENFNLLYDEWVNIKSYEDYVKCFAIFKQVIRNVFFNRYLEIIKINITKNTQFVCSYFFNFIFIFLYPFIPEFIDALQYISGRRFFHPVESVLKDKSSNYKMNVIYNAFMKIKQLKIESNIRQHETCNIFIKSTPTVCSIFAENEQIFKNYFHILDFNYLRIHESNPL